MHACDHTLSLKLLEADVVVLDLQLLNEKYGRAQIVEQDDRLTAPKSDRSRLSFSKLRMNLYRCFLTIEQQCVVGCAANAHKNRRAHAKRLYMNAGVGMLRRAPEPHTV